jgi:ADP-heptose:LPS heptosyltransferase
MTPRYHMAPELIITTWGGIGDVLLLTPALRALCLSSRFSRITVECVSSLHAEVLELNPYIDAIRDVTPQGLSSRVPTYLIHQKGATTVRCRPVYARLRPMLYRRHASRLIGELLDIAVDSTTIDLRLSSAEDRLAASALKPYRVPVIIHVTSASTPNHQWPLSYWRQLVSRNANITFIQLGLMTEPHVEGAVDLRGKTTLRQACALLRFARSFVGVDSVFGHVCNAFDVAGVVLFGPSSPHVWGHQNNVNLTRELRCSPCVDLLLRFKCPYGVRCLQDLDVLVVEDALRSQLARPSAHSVPSEVRDTR